MSDPQTILEPDCYYHVYNHAVGRENLFENENDYRYFFKKMKEHIIPVSEVLAYCLLPNHFHLVVRIKSREESEKHFRSKMGDLRFDKKHRANTYFLSEQISKLYSNLFNTYAKHFNFVKGRRGTLFKRTFRRKRINDEVYLKRLICYVHQNPVTAGFVAKPVEWKYSSYVALFSTQGSLIPREEIISLFDGLENLEFCHKHYEEIILT